MRSFVRRSEGSITIEAALVFPFVALVSMAFVACMQLVMAELALQQAASQTVKLVSAYIAPVSIVQQTGPGQQATQVIDSASSWLDHIDAAAKRLAAYESYLPGQLSSSITEATSMLRQTSDASADAALSVIFRPMLLAQLHDTVWVNSDEIKIKKVVFPHLSDRSKAYFGLTVVCEVKLKLPFYTTTIPIEVDAYERVWLAG